MKLFKRIALAVVALLLVASAVAPTYTASAASASLSIVPTKNYTVDPGKVINDTLLIRNIDKTDELTLTLKVIDFTYTDDSGTPKLFLGAEHPQTTWSLRSYLNVPDMVTIPAGSSKSVDISLNVPANVGAGSYYSAIVYSSGAADGGNVGLSASGVTLVFASVPGDVNEKLTLEKLGAYRQARGDTKADFVYFTADKPDAIAYTLNNQGNVTEAPVGSITIRDWFGNETVIDDVNPNGSLALIGQTRTYIACIKSKAQEARLNGEIVHSTACVEPDLWPGFYTIKLNLFYGQNGNNTEEITGTSSFWYLPWWFVILVIVVLGTLFIVGWLVSDKVRSKVGDMRSKKVLKNWKR